jgi:hypothetical protein
VSHGRGAHARLPVEQRSAIPARCETDHRRIGPTGRTLVRQNAICASRQHRPSCAGTDAGPAPAGSLTRANKTRPRRLARTLGHVACAAAQDRSYGTSYRSPSNADPERCNMKGSSGECDLKEKSSERKGQFCSLAPVLRLFVGCIFFVPRLVEPRLIEETRHMLSAHSSAGYAAPSTR